MARKMLVYADANHERLTRVTEMLVPAGYEVYPCSEQRLLAHSALIGVPDLVLVSADIAAALTALASALWPAVPVLVVGDSAEDQLPQQIRAALRQIKK